MANRATIGNMSPKYGSCDLNISDRQDYAGVLGLTGRKPEQIALIEAYAKEQGLWHDALVEPRYSERLELDLSTVVPSIAGPKRPQDRIALTEAKQVFPGTLATFLGDAPQKIKGYDEAVAGSFPASDPPSREQSEKVSDAPSDHVGAPPEIDARTSNPIPILLGDRSRCEIDHGSVVIAAITSCTNTSNPNVMLAAALLAKKAVELSLSRKPWVKTSLARAHAW